MYNVFVSYLRDDNTEALRLADELQSKGAVVWVDVSDLLPGQPWRQEIAEAIRQAEFFLACFSSTYEERPDNGLREELNYVISLRKAGQTHPEILPVKLNECDIPDLQIDLDTNLKDLHWRLLDDQNWESGVKQLVEITLRMAKERAKTRLKAEAEEVVVQNSQLVWAREELTTHERRVIQQQINREIHRRNSPQYFMESHSFDLPNDEPAKEVARREMEYEYALSQYRQHAVEFVQRFGDEYHPLIELFDQMEADKNRIHQLFEDARRAEEARIDEAVKAAVVFLCLLTLVGILCGTVWDWFKSAVGF